jgi:isopentenyl diphosphate isomerase/L-lactate dehydrogenase-like FMN-dependent dehydrogenase
MSGVQRKTVDRRAATLAAYAALAEQLIEPGAFAYYAGGAGDEVTLEANHAAWNRLQLLPPVLTGVAARDLGVSVLGRHRPHPLIVAPMAFQRLAHVEGEEAMARGASRAGAVMSLSTLATSSPAAVAAAAPQQPRWYQVYVFSDRGVTRSLVDAAVEHGYEALVLTVDLPISGIRDRDRAAAASFDVAGQVASASAAGAAGPLTPAEFTRLIDPSLSWSDVEAFVADSPLPVVIKGVLRASDAVRAADVGAAGVVVSNHGGRQLDTVPATAEVLPAVVDAAGDRIDVLVDGGVRRGIDVVKAIALGARAVMVGRPLLWGLAVGGADGVEHVLQILLEELDVAVALCGAARLDSLPPELIRAL